MKRKVFKPTKNMNRMALAANEGVIMKKLIGSLRSLWRSSSKGSDERISELKSYLRPSPARESPEPEAENASDVDPPVSVADDSDDASDRDDGEGELVAVAESQQDNDSDGESLSPESNPPICDCEDAPVAVDSQGESNAEDSQGESNAEGPTASQEEFVKASQESVATLDAPTLKLGGESDSEDSNGPKSSESDTMQDPTDSEEHRDSQVSSGWLGRAYMYENEKACKAAAKQKLKDKLTDMVRGIKTDLETQLRGEILTDTWTPYAMYARQALKDYGDQVYGDLASATTFQQWLRKRKSEDRCLVYSGT